uniref:EOG090X0COM n=1 Tax=Moina brachiata TaxID=675436 RepID=A0A4Y7NJ38_9CRUS|nr:EOG090X0COM [Moina brachiata]SVE93240.1 EOG090X0COM [Moina brachiata]
MWSNIVSSAARFLGSCSQVPLFQSPAIKGFINNSLVQLQVRHINKQGFANEPGWKAIGYRWMVKFPEDGKYTTRKLKLMKLAGRDPKTGRVVVATLGGGQKLDYLWVDNNRNGPKEGPPLVEKVIKIIQDPCRSAWVALVAGGEQPRYIIATSSMKPGDLISTSGHIPRIAIRPKEGDAHPLGALPVGTEVCCVEKFPGEGSFVAVTAGSHAVLLRKVGDRCIIQLPSKQEISVKQECMATVGRVSNPEHSSIPIGSAQRLRWLGYRPRSGLWHRKDGRFGRKIRPLPPIKVMEKKKPDLTGEMVLSLPGLA